MHSLVVALGLALPTVSIPTPTVPRSPTCAPPHVLVAHRAPADGRSSSDATKGPSPAGPAERTRPGQVVIELVERSSATARSSSRYEVGLLPDGSPSRLETDDGAVRTKLTVRHRHREAAPGTLWLDVDRERRGDRGESSVRTAWSMQASVAPGKRVSLGKVARADGTGLEVIVTVR